MIFNLFGPKAPAVTVHALAQKLDSGEPLFLLDVRTGPEFDMAHVVATNALIPHDILGHHVDRLPADKTLPIYIICRSGRRSAFSTNLLRSRGYVNAFNVGGGILDWINSGYATRSRGDREAGLNSPKDFFSLA